MRPADASCLYDGKRDIRYRVYQLPLFWSYEATSSIMIIQGSRIGRGDAELEAFGQSRLSAVH